MASELHVDAIKHSGGTSALTIDSSGRVLQPSVPAFRVSLTSDQSITATGDHVIEWNEGTTSESDNNFTQGGFSWSSGVVTVPVAGVYSFSVILRVDNVGSGYLVAKMSKNDDTSANRDGYMIDGSPPSNYTNLTGSNIFKCNANDNIRMLINTSADTNYTVQNQSHFSGHLIG